MNLIQKLKSIFKKKQPLPAPETTMCIFEMNVGQGAYKAQAKTLNECKEAVIDVANRINTTKTEYIN